MKLLKKMKLLIVMILEVKYLFHSIIYIIILVVVDSDQPSAATDFQIPKIWKRLTLPKYTLHSNIITVPFVAVLKDYLLEVV